MNRPTSAAICLATCATLLLLGAPIASAAGVSITSAQEKQAAAKCKAAQKSYDGAKAQTKRLEASHRKLVKDEATWRGRAEAANKAASKAITAKYKGKTAKARSAGAKALTAANRDSKRAVSMQKSLAPKIRAGGAKVQAAYRGLDRSAASAAKTCSVPANAFTGVHFTR